MNILIACEESGAVRDAFIKKGHNAISCDLMETSSPGPHLQGDVLSILNNYKWDMIIAHPPCTYLSNSGVCHLYNKDGSHNMDRWIKLEQAHLFFNEILSADCPRICIENPIPHKYGVGKTYQQLIQPWMFGHKETKATCLWLRGLPKLTETDNVKEEMLKLSKKEINRMHYLSPGPDRAKLRSKTYQGIANAMANQWG
tara:strand:- start:166 stop:762 length:597 start_codon:yes stop_codon:yes gene_type:complete